MTQTNLYREKISATQKYKFVSAILIIGFIFFIFALTLFPLRSYLLAFILLAILTLFLIIIIALQKKRYTLDLIEYHSLIEKIDLPILWLNDESKIIFANSAFLARFGIEESVLIGKKFLEVIKPTYKEDLKTDLWMEIKSSIDNRKKWNGEISFFTATNQKIVSILTVIPIFAGDKKLEKVIAQFNDITELSECTRKIEETQKQYKSIVENSLDGILVIQDGLLEYINPAAVKLFGYSSVDEMKKIKFIDAIAVQNRQSLIDGYSERAVGAEILRNYEMRALTKSGRLIDLEVNAIIIEWKNKPAVQASFRDITERKMLEREQALWLWEQETLSDIDKKLAGIMDLKEIFLAILQQTLNLTRAHFSAVIIVHKSTGELEWKAIQGNTLKHELSYFTPNEALSSIIKNVEPVVIHHSKDKQYDLSKIPIIVEEKLESTIWLPLRIDNESKGIFIVGYRQSHDFSGREMRMLNSLVEKCTIAMVNTKLYADLLQREKELEILSNAHVQAQEEERRRIAREIHDGLGQMLTAIKFNLEILEDMIQIGKEQRERIDDMKNLLDSVMKEARDISYNLMPSVLEDFGLSPALQLLSEQFANRTGIKINYHAQGFKERLEPNMEVGLYRIAQESLNNIAKHSEATEVNLQIFRYPGGMRLLVEDNGKGIRAKTTEFKQNGKSGMGLVNMRERASSLGGTFTIDSMPDHGTIVTVEIPLIN